MYTERRSAAGRRSRARRRGRRKRGKPAFLPCDLNRLKEADAQY
jgi:hypothetical protein